MSLSQQERIRQSMEAELTGPDLYKGIMERARDQRIAMLKEERRLARIDGDFAHVRSCDQLLAYAIAAKQADYGDMRPLNALLARPQPTASEGVTA